MDIFDFTGKKIVVTGASSGVGRATAILLSKMGARVVLVARRENELKNTISLMEKGDHCYKVVDLSEFDDVINTIKEIVACDNKKIDAIAHCAGIVKVVPMRSICKQDIDNMMYTNFYSFAALLKCVASKRLFNDGGAVVGVSSYVAVNGQVANSIYGASKGAINAMIKTAAKELKSRRIRVNAVNPIGIRTPMVLSKESLQQDCDNYPNLLLAEKVASIIVGLLSDSFEYISGATIDIDRAENWEG